MLYHNLFKSSLALCQPFHAFLSMRHNSRPFLFPKNSLRWQLSNRKRTLPVAKETTGLWRIVSLPLELGRLVRLLLPERKSIFARVQETTNQSVERLLEPSFFRGSYEIGSNQQVEFQLSTTMPKQKKYILVIDDEASVREVTAEILREANVHTLEAEDGLVGLELFRRHAEQIVLVLLDFSMPGLNGGQVLEQMRKIDPTIPILFFSGYGQHEVVRRFYRSGTVGFLQKPYTINELLLAVRNNRKRD